MDDPLPQESFEGVDEDEWVSDCDSVPPLQVLLWFFKITAIIKQPASISCKLRIG